MLWETLGNVHRLMRRVSEAMQRVAHVVESHECSVQAVWEEIALWVGAWHRAWTRNAPDASHPTAPQERTRCPVD